MFGAEIPSGPCHMYNVPEMLVYVELKVFTLRVRESSLVTTEAHFTVRLQHVLEMLPCPSKSKTNAGKYIVRMKKLLCIRNYKNRCVDPNFPHPFMYTMRSLRDCIIFANIYYRVSCGTETLIINFAIQTTVFNLDYLIFAKVVVER